MRTHKLIPLFCKPAIDADPDLLLYARFCPELNGVIAFRSLNLSTDLEIIHRWAHLDYSQQFWQMNGHFSQLYAIYQCMELNPYSHSFVGLFNGNMICQFDVYSVFADELREHVAAESFDCGFHLLMAPNKSPIHGLTTGTIEVFLEYFFSFAEAKRMYAEPDTGNLKSIRLLEKCGFLRGREVNMSYKKAVVYCRERQ